MKNLIKSRMSSKLDSSNYTEYNNCVSDLIKNETVCLMENYIQHGKVSCLEHCIYVSYISYVMSKALGLDYRSAARGGLLHDFFLYDWHVSKPYKGMHGFAHPYVALKNATRLFELNDIEKDIIVKHMWPLTVIPPKYRETHIVSMADKYCAVMEVITSGRSTVFCRLITDTL